MSRQGKSREKTYTNIKDFWRSEASEWGNTPQVTIRDYFFRNHELHTLLTLIPRCMRLLDIGCGTGFGTLVLSPRADYVLGVDYDQTMIEWAKRARDDIYYRMEQSKKLRMLYQMGIEEYSNVEFSVGDLLDLKLVENDFDVITGQRILINIPTEIEQFAALENLRRCAGNKSKLILIEATLQGHERTDNYRKGFDLPPLEKYWHNNYIVESHFDRWNDCGWKVVNTLSFETYTLLSKVLYPVAVGQENCKFLSGANEAACEVASIFRSKSAAEEIGMDKMLKMYVDRVTGYDEYEGNLINKYLQGINNDFPDWTNLGHQRIIIAEAS